MPIDVLRFKSNGNYRQAVQGESNYQDHLSDTVEETENRLTEAGLYLEDFNKFDHNAVAVVIGAETVGYLSRADAITYRHAIRALGHPIAIGECAAKITGGHELEDGGQAHYGIVLDLDLNNLEIENIEQTKSAAEIEQSIHPVASQTLSSPKPAKMKTAMTAQKRFTIFVGAMLAIACIIPSCYFVFGMLQGIWEIIAGK